jgi:hypothetical protein
VTDEQRITLYRNRLLQDGTLRIAPVYAEVFKRARPAASFEPDSERPDLVRVTRLLDPVRP